MITSLEHVSKSFGVQLVLDDITAKIEDRDKIGLIGVNGAGKSTLLNIIHGDLEPDDGRISRSTGVRIGFLRQNSGLSNAGTIQSEMRAVFSDLLKMESDMRDLEAAIASSSDNSPRYTELTGQYARLQELFEQREGYQIDVKIATVLNGMGFGGVDRNTAVSVLSGGEKTRLALCKLLLEEPELLILDEPTNHLDFKTLLWLENYLAGYRGALLVVSHDRYFLDRLCTSIWEVFDRRLNAYKGNYSQFVVQREERLERRRKEYEAQQAEIADLKDFVARNLVRASTTKRAQSRQKVLDKMELVEKPKLPPKPPKLSFRYKREPVKDVLHVQGLNLSVGEGAERVQLLDGVDFDLLKGEKVALIGSNGVGKSSFLKALQNLIPHDKGNIEWGRGTDISYFEQEEFAMDSDRTAIDELWSRFPREYEHTIRTVLGNVGLTGENVFKRVGTLSGGERAKLKFAILILSCGNVLLMDEPTNHLDLAAKEVLDAALQDYTGTLLVVSHDRYLLNKFPTKIAEMHGDHIRIYSGNYDRYLQQKEQEGSGAALAQSASAAGESGAAGGRPAETSASTGYHRSKKQRSEAAARKKRIDDLELRIVELETVIWNLETEIASPEIAGDYVLLQEKCDILEEKRVDLGCAMNEWSALAEESAQ